MKKTFKELLDGISGEDKINKRSYEVVINLMKLVREKTLKEASINARADYLKDKEGNVWGLRIIRKSILNLDKDTIEV